MKQRKKQIGARYVAKVRGAFFKVKLPRVPKLATAAVQVVKGGRESRQSRTNSRPGYERSTEIPQMRGIRGSFLGGLAAGGKVAQFRLRHARKKVVGGRLSPGVLSPGQCHG